MCVLFELGRGRDLAHREAFRLAFADRRPVRHSGQNLRDVTRLDRRSVALKLAGHVHETAEIACEHRIGFDAADVVDFARDDRVREFAVFGREQSAKAATDFRIGQFDQLQALDSGQKPPRLRLDAELAQTCAGIVIGDGSLIARRDLLDAHDVDQEADQFVRSFGKPLGPLREIRLAREKFGIMLDQHAPA